MGNWAWRGGPPEQERRARQEPNSPRRRSEDWIEAAVLVDKLLNVDIPDLKDRLAELEKGMSNIAFSEYLQEDLQKARVKISQFNDRQQTFHNELSRFQEKFKGLCERLDELTEIKDRQRQMELKQSNLLREVAALNKAVWGLAVATIVGTALLSFFGKIF